MVLYFTGTGNSKYIANLIGERIGDTTVDAAAHIKAGHYPHFASEQPYVFVAPVYA